MPQRLRPITALILMLIASLLTKVGLVNLIMMAAQTYAWFFLLMFVVPQFSQMFDDMGQTLPLPTQIVIAVGDLLRGYWWVLFSGGLLLIALVHSRLQIPEVRYRWDRRLRHGSARRPWRRLALQAASAPGRSTSRAHRFQT